MAGLQAVEEDTHAIRDENNHVTVQLGDHRFRVNLLPDIRSRTIGYKLEGRPSPSGVMGSNNVRPVDYAQFRGNLENAFKAWLKSHYDELNG